MIINGAGTTQKQSDWTVQGLFNEYFAVVVTVACCHRGTACVIQ